MSQTIIGWRLELVRSSLDWRGNDYISAKTEFYSLLLKLAFGNQPIRVSVYTDKHTLHQFYEKWLDECGIDISRITEPVHFHTLELKKDQRSDFDQKAHLELWYQAAADAIDKSLEGIESLYPDFPPDWLYVHQKTQDDAIVAVWIDQRDMKF